ncbi:MAG: hypothetical protein GF331_00540 [Chitinivibrionales bacterium]|nr:hypothetical protein [Chitinivibrionales bacterium]
MDTRAKGTVAGIAVWLTLLGAWAAAQTANECSPPCRQGFVCQDGKCISACNPPCPLGYRCDAEALDCIPLQPSAPPATTFAPQPRVRGYCTDHSECAPGYICFDSDCERASYVSSAGNVAFNSTHALYGIGSAYSSLTPIILSFAGYREDCDYYYGLYNSYCYSGYDEEEAAVSLAPQSSMFVIFGALNRVAISKQARYLHTLGAQPSATLVAFSWGLYGASVSTATLNIFSYFSKDQDYVVTTAFINAAVLLSSFVVNTVCYAKQARLLEEAVATRRTDGQTGTSRFMLVPYVQASRDGGGGGLALRF